MTSRGPGWASRTPEMEEKEQLRRQIRLLQGLIDDYKTLHGNGPALGTSATRWQPPTYQGGRTFGARYSRSSRRGFSHHGPSWRKKYSLVNQPLDSSDPASDHALQASLRSRDSQHPDPQQYVLERQVQLSPDQNMVIKIKPPSKTGSTSTSGVQRGPLEDYDESSWSDQRPQGSEVGLPGGQLQPPRPGRTKSEAGSKDHTSQLSPVPSRSPLGDRTAVGPSNLKPVFGETPLSAYKVKSRTKIIRRRGSTSLPGDKKNSPSATTTTKNHLTQRRRQALRGKNSPILRKTPHKSLMQVTRPRLCCMPSSRAHLSTKEASSVHQRTPPSNKVIKTRYRIVKKTPTLPLSAPSFPSSLPSWRARRISLSRSLVLNRLRPAVTGGGKAPPGSPRWRNKGYRCIGGVLYKVSANKLSKTSSRPSDGSRALLRTGRLDPATSCSRSLASRAVQRSLAIIRQAKQKKEKKREYCMYYNRFGRCNRGECCPYIHDPEKVAVCTRFVRGTCKKTDGSCPFSHHVSKEKMPVCSYFLKGICSNSNCPYSHVYVSRKAEVCSDFLKGYCPLGAKCKKKHTLLCPDFARRGICPRGAQCQLLHRNQKRHGRRTAAPSTPGPSDGAPRSRASAGHVLRKPSTAQRPARQMSSGLASRTEALASPPHSPRVLASTSTLSSKATVASSSSSSPSASSSTPSLDQEEAASGTGGTGSGTGSSSLCKLPSFISLHSSPSPGGQSGPQTPRSPRTKDSGKPLHIKPRL
ncbi:zinc finger protein CCCH domain-containing protein 3 [Sigmodon hispidus]